MRSVDLTLLEFSKASSGANTYAELESLVNRSVSELWLMLFIKLDLGAVLRKESGLARPKAQRFIIGNPLIMKEMVKEVPEAGSYAPFTLLVARRSSGNISTIRRRRPRHEEAGSLPWETWVASTRRATST